MTNCVHILSDFRGRLTDIAILDRVYPPMHPDSGPTSLYKRWISSIRSIARLQDRPLRLAIALARIGKGELAQDVVICASTCTRDSTTCLWADLGLPATQ